jgi:hypothetical protein
MIRKHSRATVVAHSVILANGKVEIGLWRIYNYPFKGFKVNLGWGTEKLVKHYLKKQAGKPR